MCGISGAFGLDSEKVVENIVFKQKHRGPDYSKVVDFYGLKLGHNLLSIVGFAPQPFQSKGCVLVANCEIYNWEDVAKDEKIDAKNDAELLFKLLQKHKSNVKEAIKKLNGDFAFAFFYKNKNFTKGYLARDIFGVRPLWYYGDNKNFVFASERKYLPKNIKLKAVDLNPRILLKVDINLDLETVKIKKEYLGFLQYKVVKDNYEKAKLKTERLLEESIKQRVKSDKKVGVLVSGGLDSSLIAKFALKYSENICFYNISTDRKAIDKDYAKKVEKHLGIKIKYVYVTEEEALLAIPKVIRIIETADPVKVSIALSFYFLAKQMQKDKIKVVLVGNGADSLFCGFSRFFPEYSPTKDTISRLRKLYDTDTYRDDTIFMNFSIEARFPYLDKALVEYVVSLPDGYKISTDRKKIILRDIASKYFSEELAERKKKAIQYGSGFDKFLTKYMKLNKGKTRGTALGKTITENERLACLFSGGKDSVLALHIMHNMNYKIPCLITIDSKNKDSYMYHTPTIDLVELQAEALGIPLIKVKTLGKKEEELDALKQALKLAMEKYNVNGVITGALYSTYQRDRVDKISDELGLKVFSPLWHKKQGEEVKELISLGIEPIITKIAAYGLAKDILGKVIDRDLLNKFKDLNAKIGFNVAGEGGEYETFVLDSQLFKKRIVVKKSVINQETEYTGELIIKKVELKEK